MALSQEKKGGPYTKVERRKRLDEVYRLYFEYGYSARKISEFLNINRNTINGDIDNLRFDIAKKWGHLDPETFVKDQVERFEIQRTRLRKQLDNTESFKEKNTIEKFIFNIDTKITDFQMRLVESETRIYRKTAKGINENYKADNNSKRVISADFFFKVSEKAQEEMYKIFTEDTKF